MTEHRKHIEPSAELIRLYHEGKLDDRTMHALEKQALDDPFLADALDGFAAAPAAAADTHLQDLHKRLEERVAGKQERPKIWQLNYKWAAAAVILVLLSAGTFLLINTKQRTAMQTVAKQEHKTPQQDSATPDVVSDEQAPAASARPQLPSPLGSAAEVKEKPVADNNNVKMDTAALAINVVREDQFKREAAKQGNRFTRKTDTTYYDFVAPPGMVAREIERAKGEDSPRSIMSMNVGRDTLAGKLAMQNALEGKTAGVVIRGQSSLPARSNMPGRFVEGRVTDDNNNPLPGVTVVNTSGKNGVATDADGYFRLKVDSNKVNQLDVAFVGYERKSVRLSDKDNNLAIALEPSHNRLEEVVVMGYGVKKRKSITGSVSNSEGTYPEGGFGAFKQYLYDSTRYPMQMEAAGINGSVIVSFVVDKNGELSHFQLVKKLNNIADAEAIRVIKEGPQWVPSNKKKTRKVKVEVFFPHQEEK